MDAKKVIVSAIGYLVTLFITPVIGLAYGGALFFFKKDDPFYRKQGQLIIYFSIIIFIVTIARVLISLI